VRKSKIVKKRKEGDWKIDNWKKPEMGDGRGSLLEAENAVRGGLKRVAMEIWNEGKSERAKRSKLDKVSEGQRRWNESKNINTKRKKETEGAEKPRKKRFGLCVVCLCFYVAI